jgi:hypothetical protein
MTGRKCPNETLILKLSIGWYKWPTLFLEDMDSETWSSMLREFVLRKHSNNCKLQTHPIVRQAALNNIPATF